MVNDSLACHSTNRTGLKFDTRVKEIRQLFSSNSLTLGLVSISGSDKNRKRDVNQYYRGRDDRNEVRNALPGRGDIPIIHGDCDGVLSCCLIQKFLKFISILYG